MDLTLKEQVTKSNIDKLDDMKLKSSRMAKKIIKRVKRQPAGYENISANHISDKGLISKIYR